MLDPHHEINQTAIREHQERISSDVRASILTSGPGPLRTTIGEVIIRFGEYVHGHATVQSAERVRRPQVSG